MNYAIQLLPGDVLNIFVPGTDQHIADPGGIASGAKERFVEVTKGREIFFSYVPPAPINEKNKYVPVNTWENWLKFQEIMNVKTDKT